MSGKKRSSKIKTNSPSKVSISSRKRKKTTKEANIDEPEEKDRVLNSSILFNYEFDLEEKESENKEEASLDGKENSISHQKTNNPFSQPKHNPPITLSSSDEEEEIKFKKMKRPTKKRNLSLNSIQPISARQSPKKFSLSPSKIKTELSEEDSLLNTPNKKNENNNNHQNYSQESTNIPEEIKSLFDKLKTEKIGYIVETKKSGTSSTNIPKNIISPVNKNSSPLSQSGTPINKNVTLINNSETDEETTKH